MNVKHGLIDLIGDTPLVSLENIKKKYHLESDIYAKLERTNPTGSIKDRAAKQMILDALEEKKINQDTVLVEPTSGNTGIGLAAIAAYLKMRLVIFMPASCSVERIKMMRAYGAEVILTPAEKGMSGAVEASDNYIREHDNSFVVGQFSNLSNLKAHYLTTAREIYRALDGNIDCFIAGFGTGGTLSGTAKYLKEQKPEIKIIGLEPLSSSYILKRKVGPHKIQGIGAGFQPGNLKLEYVDEILAISDTDAYDFTRILAKEEGLLCGISSGCNLCGAIEIAKKYKYKNIVTVFPDNGERYLSVEGLYE